MLFFLYNCALPFSVSALHNQFQYDLNSEENRQYVESVNDEGWYHTDNEDKVC